LELLVGDLELVVWGCLGFDLEQLLFVCHVFHRPEKKKTHHPKNWSAKNRFLRYLYPKPNGTFWAFERPPCHPSILLRSNLSTVQLSFQKSRG